MSEYMNHSGGCPGSDMMWENEGNKFGVTTVAYSFYNHVQDSPNQLILTHSELNDGFKHVEIAEKSLKRGISTMGYPYVKNLLSRNWYQVKNAEAVFAIGTFLNIGHGIVNGGTGWAVQMAVDNKKPVYFFNQKEKDFGKFDFGWHSYNYDNKKFVRIEIPRLTKHFAGIGTRELNKFGEAAIRNIYEFNFK